MSLIAAAAITAGAALTQAAVNLYQQSKTNADNKAMQKEQLDYQKYLNANQYRIQAADMQAAGINPAMGNMNSLQSGSYQSQSAPQIDLSAISQLAATNLQVETSKKISDDTLSADEARYSAQLASNEKIESSRLDEEVRHNKAQELIAAANSKNSEEAVKATKEAQLDSNARTVYERSSQELSVLNDALNNEATLEKELREIYRSHGRKGNGGLIGNLQDFTTDLVDASFELFTNNEAEFINYYKNQIIERTKKRIVEVTKQRDAAYKRLTR